MKNILTLANGQTAAVKNPPVVYTAQPADPVDGDNTGIM